MKIIEGRHLVKAFGEGNEKRNVLDDVSVEIGEGEFVSVMGPSGSGKSTLLFVLSGMDGADGGKVAFGGKDLSLLKDNELADLRRTGMGFVFQKAALLSNLNILDNIILPSVRDNAKNTAKLTEKAKGLMKKVGIEGLEDRDLTQVSGGQLQRAGICRALMGDPNIIFGDEPTGALNSKTAAEIMDILADINRDGTAILLVTHDAVVAAKTERILFMLDGKIASEMMLHKFKGERLEERMEAVTAKMREIGI
ncbi:ABC transporter ATP-binding protein [Paenibacillus sp. CAU 1782]